MIIPLGNAFPAQVKIENMGFYTLFLLRKISVSTEQLLL